MTSQPFAHTATTLRQTISDEENIKRSSSSRPPALELVPNTSEAPDGYKRLKFQVIGVSPLIMHNGQLANPLNPHARQMKRITEKRKKTDADYEQLAKLAWFGGLYLDDEKRPCIPGEVIEGTFIRMAKKLRLGEQAKAGMISTGPWALEYDGPRDLEELWSDERFRLSAIVIVKGSRIVRTRPIFRQWALSFDIDFMPDELNQRGVIDMVHTMGRIVGFGDWRPKFGRFNVIAE